MWSSEPAVRKSPLQTICRLLRVCQAIKYERYRRCESCGCPLLVSSVRHSRCFSVGTGRPDVRSHHAINHTNVEVTTMRQRALVRASARLRRRGLVRAVGRVLAIGCVSLIVGVQVEAATLVVDDDGMGSAANCNDTAMAYTTISSAVAAASPNDTIIVCPGLYPEQVTINKTLTLLGAQVNVDARTRPFVPTNESIIDHPCGPVQIEADKVVINGFTIQGSMLPDPCFLSGIWTNPGFSGTNGG